MSEKKEPIWTNITPELAEAILLETQGRRLDPGKVLFYRKLYRAWLDNQPQSCTITEPPKDERGEETWEVQFIGQPNPTTLKFKKGVKVATMTGGVIGLLIEPDVLFAAPVTMVQYIRKVEANG